MFYWRLLNSLPLTLYSSCCWMRAGKYVPGVFWMLTSSSCCHAIPSVICYSSLLHYLQTDLGLKLALTLLPLLQCTCLFAFSFFGCLTRTFTRVIPIYQVIPIIAENWDCSLLLRLRQIVVLLAIEIFPRNVLLLSINTLIVVCSKKFSMNHTVHGNIKYCQLANVQMCKNMNLYRKTRWV